MIEPPGPWGPRQTYTLRSACAGLRRRLLTEPPLRPSVPGRRSRSCPAAVACARRCRGCPAAPGLLPVAQVRSVLVVRLLGDAREGHVGHRTASALTCWVPKLTLAPPPAAAAHVPVWHGSSWRWRFPVVLQAKASVPLLQCFVPRPAWTARCAMLLGMVQRRDETAEEPYKNLSQNGYGTTPVFTEPGFGERAR